MPAGPCWPATAHWWSERRKDLRQAHLRVITLEWRCKRAYEVKLLGGGVPLSDEEVEKVAITDPNGFPFCWEAMARRELRADPGILD